MYRKEVDIVGNGVFGRLFEEESLLNEFMVDFIINFMFVGNEIIAKIMLFVVYFFIYCFKVMI